LKRNSILKYFLHATFPRNVEYKIPRNNMLNLNRPSNSTHKGTPRKTFIEEEYAGLSPGRLVPHPLNNPTGSIYPTSFGGVQLQEIPFITSNLPSHDPGEGCLATSGWSLEEV